MKILITGGAGFIGSHTANMLVSRSHKILVIDDLSTGKLDKLSKQIPFQTIDLSGNFAEIESVFKEFSPEVVYHFAYKSNVAESMLSPEKELTNFKAAANTFRACVASKVKKVIFSSSGYVYGDSPPYPSKESKPLMPGCPYAIIKVAVENLLKMYARGYGFEYFILRYPVVYGPKQSAGALTDYIRKSLEDKPIDIWGDGRKTRDYVYITDIVEANLALLTLDRTNLSINLGSEIEVTLSDLHRKICSILGKKPNIQYIADRPGELQRCCLDSTRAKELLKWKARTSLDSGLREKILAFQEENK